MRSIFSNSKFFLCRIRNQRPKMGSVAIALPKNGDHNPACYVMQFTNFIVVSVPSISRETLEVDGQSTYGQDFETTFTFSQYILGRSPGTRQGILEKDRGKRLNPATAYHQHLLFFRFRPLYFGNKKAFKISQNFCKNKRWMRGCSSPSHAGKYCERYSELSFLFISSLFIATDWKKNMVTAQTNVHCSTQHLANLVSAITSSDQVLLDRSAGYLGRGSAVRPLRQTVLGGVNPTKPPSCASRRDHVSGVRSRVRQEV